MERTPADGQVWPGNCYLRGGCAAWSLPFGRKQVLLPLHATSQHIVSVNTPMFRSDPALTSMPAAVCDSCQWFEWEQDGDSRCRSRSGSGLVVMGDNFFLRTWCHLVTDMRRGSVCSSSSHGRCLFDKYRVFLFPISLTSCRNKKCLYRIRGLHI